MLQYWICQWDDLTISAYTKDDQYIFIEAKDSSQIKWSIEIDATEGDSWLMARTRILSKPSPGSDSLIIETDGEHARGATSHNRQTISISKEGKIIWQKQG